MILLDHLSIKTLSLIFSVILATLAAVPEAGAQQAADSSPPAWFVDRSEEPEHGIFVFVQTPRPCNSPMEAEEALEAACIEQVRQSIETWHPHASDNILIDKSVIASELVYKKRFDVKTYSDDHTSELNSALDKDFEYFRGYAQLLLTDDFHKKVDINWQTNQTKSRLTQIALIGLTVFGLLATLFGYLKMQTLTRGFYTGHLQVICIAIIIALVVLFFWLLKTL